MRCEDAIYHQAILPEHRGNPLIEALPPKVEDDELVIKLSNCIKSSGLGTKYHGKSQTNTNNQLLSL